LFEELAARSDGRVRRAMMATVLAGVEGCHQRAVIRGWDNPIAILQGAEEPYFSNAGPSSLG
jgi:hypothetical protein